MSILIQTINGKVWVCNLESHAMSQNTGRFLDQDHRITTHMAYFVDEKDLCSTCLPAKFKCHWYERLFQSIEHLVYIRKTGLFAGFSDLSQSLSTVSWNALEVQIEQAFKYVYKQNCKNGRSHRLSFSQHRSQIIFTAMFLRLITAPKQVINTWRYYRDRSSSSNSKVGRQICLIESGAGYDLE